LKQSKSININNDNLRFLSKKKSGLKFPRQLATEVSVIVTVEVFAVVNCNRLTSAIVNCRRGILVFYWCVSALWEVYTAIFVSFSFEPKAPSSQEAQKATLLAHKGLSIVKFVVLTCWKAGKTPLKYVNVSTTVNCWSVKNQRYLTIDGSGGS